MSHDHHTPPPRDLTARLEDANAAGSMPGNLYHLLVSEIRRGRDGYRPGEDSFKESGAIECSADLAMTLDRPSADEEDAEAVATLRVQLARDCDEDPQGDVASYAPLRAYHGLDERDPVKPPVALGRLTRPESG